MDNTIMKEKKDLISIIIPVFNAENYLKQCLNSIINQTYRNLQIIVIDDGSTDGSGEIIDKYASIEDRIKVVHKKNGGVASCRNIGLSLASGKYIAWVDADDYIDKTYIEILYNVLIDNESDIVQCKFKKVKSEEYPFDVSDIKTSVLDYKKKIILERYAEENKSICTIYLWDKLYKKSLFDGIEFPLRSNSEDRAILCQVLSRIKKFTVVDKTLYAYRLSPFSLTRSRVKYNFVKSAIDTEIERIDFFKSIGSKDLYLKSLVAFEKVMIVTYCRCLLYLKDNQLEMQIFDLYKKYFKQVVGYKKLSLIRKLQFVFFRLCKKIYAYTVFKAYDSR